MSGYVKTFKVKDEDTDAPTKFSKMGDLTGSQFSEGV